MKGIRMAVLGAALVLGVTTAAEAQRGGAGGGRGRAGIARLMTDITVSADVQTKIDSVVARFGTQQRALMGAPAGGNPGGMRVTDAQRTKMMEFNTKRNAEIRALLTAEQQIVFDRNVAAAPQRRRGGGARARVAAPPPLVPAAF